jgi:DNA-binding Lrp family transcriptional regulator
MIDLNIIDTGILALLGKNARITGPKISEELSKWHISLTDRAVLQRIARLQEKKIIQGYTTTLDPSILSEKNTSLIFFRFVTPAKRIEIDRLDSYLTGESFCLFAARLGAADGEFNYICQLVFDTQKQFDLMLGVIMRRFGNLISEYMIYQSKIIKQVSYSITPDSSLERKTKTVLISAALSKSGNIWEKLRQFTDDIRKCFDAKCVCLWLIDKKTDELTLTNAYGNYEYIPVEYAEISWSSINLESILRTKKPVLVNDLLNEFEGINVEWLIKENVLSYAGYPLQCKDHVVGILEIFNDKAFSPQDFEMASTLCEQVSGIFSNNIDFD